MDTVWRHGTRASMGTVTASTRRPQTERRAAHSNTGTVGRRGPGTLDEEACMQCTNNDISRRSFISSAALAGAASIAVPALAMADDKDATVPEKGTWKGYTPGTYSSDAMGHNAPFTVNVTFTDYALSDIDTDGNLETIGVGKLALARLGDEIVKNQSLNVDGLTGASIYERRPARRRARLRGAGRRHRAARRDPDGAAGARRGLRHRRLRRGRRRCGLCGRHRRGPGRRQRGRPRKVLHRRRFDRQRVRRRPERRGPRAPGTAGHRGLHRHLLPDHHRRRPRHGATPSSWNTW